MRMRQPQCACATNQFRGDEFLRGTIGPEMTPGQRAAMSFHMRYRLVAVEDKPDFCAGQRSRVPDR